MRNRATSEVSTHSSLEFSYSDVESVVSHLNMADINTEKEAPPATPILAPPTFSTELAKVDLDEFDTPQPDQSVLGTQMDTTTLERDAIYFCETVVLVVEDRVFCVPKGGLLEHGTYFQSLFGTQPHDDVKGGMPSSLERCPIVLEGISKVHFHNFLRVIYPFYGVDVPSGDEHWLGILDLATKWGFQKVRSFMINSVH
ncbi:hypothetical protein BJ165DRAFT_999866 [Panaeolus papilionaceus]|nr:hypothetical protein BJ165DRAFT_999866 [Panaeolus papilionaceus]